MNEEFVIKEVDDLGSSAYLLMLGFKPFGKKYKSILFKVLKNEVEEFNQKQMDYLSSDYHRFDSCLMAIKKMRIEK